ncbi:acyltransferase family protein [Allorhizocola rhizosphaerae]|uniref:acyltransferase family protein n=1 Tax=Allorhizocola rhizosphaerae TaxID=1872709 RepID=UPI000E3C5AFA|nr:acyltransferase [Allorhizocola rhizosphaerae]
MTATTQAELLPARPRDPYVDFLRALSLMVVVLWHWAFTILEWRVDGPHATSPLGFTKGLWLATWLFQVMPLFFFIGGYVHLRSWERAQSRGVTMRTFVWRRMRQLLLPAGAVLIAWIALGTLIGAYFNLTGVGRTIKLIVSPLWFLAVYLGLIALLPVSLWLHRKAGLLVLIWFGGLAMLVDVLRFHNHIEVMGWANMVLVWGLAHQAGFFYQKIVDAPRPNDWALLWTGLFGLIGLVGSGLYPGSMVGVPGERFSNVGPPTFVIVALLLFQVGTVELLRPKMAVWLERPRWKRTNKLINDFALPLFLVHTTGMALFLFLVWLVFGLDMKERANVDLGWWLTRPLAIIGPLLCTIPVLWLFRRLQKGGKQPVLGPSKESETAIAS